MALGFQNFKMTKIFFWIMSLQIFFKILKKIIQIKTLFLIIPSLFNFSYYLDFYIFQDIRYDPIKNVQC